MWEYNYQNKNCITIFCKNTEFNLKWHLTCQKSESNTYEKLFFNNSHSLSQITRYFKVKKMDLTIHLPPQYTLILTLTQTIMVYLLDTSFFFC